MAKAQTPTRAAPVLGRDLQPLAEDLTDEIELDGVAVTGELVDVDLARATLTGCHVDHAQLLGARFDGCRFVDCVFAASDLSGAVFDDCRFTRVEFRGCRLSGLQAPMSRFNDVGFLDCRLDGATLRRTVWERAEWEDCQLTDADFGDAVLPGSAMLGCDLTNTHWSKADLAGSRLHRSHLERIEGADSFRGVRITGEQILPLALALFGALGITLDEE